MNPKIYQDGLARDTRTEEEKARDYRAKPEGQFLQQLKWIEKPKAEWKKYAKREQSTSLSCMGQAGAKAVETIPIPSLLNIVESAHPSYRSRSNYPQAGMFLQDLGAQYKNVGTTLESLDISQNINEVKMNRPITVATPTKIGGYVFWNPKDIDAIAGAIELYKHCILIVHCYKSEWTAIPVANLTLDPAEYNFGHGITAVDYFLYEGKKVILIEDSTGRFNSLDKNAQRILDAEFIKARIYGAMSFTPEIPVPPFKFTQTMRLWSRGDSVVRLQEFLNTQGENLKTDGILGRITETALKKFQGSHGLVADGIAGKLTFIVINNMI